MLYNLHCPTCVSLDMSLQFQGLILDLDGFIALTWTCPSEKRQAFFLCIVSTVFFNNIGIKHHRIYRNSSALIKKCDDAFSTLIIFAAIPTQRSLCTTSVLSKSCAICKSSFVAISDFPARKIGSCISFRPYL